MYMKSVLSTCEKENGTACRNIKEEGDRYEY